MAAGTTGDSQLRKFHTTIIRMAEGRTGDEGHAGRPATAGGHA